MFCITLIESLGKLSAENKSSATSKKNSATHKKDMSSLNKLYWPWGISRAGNSCALENPKSPPKLVGGAFKVLEGARGVSSQYPQNRQNKMIMWNSKYDCFSGALGRLEELALRKIEPPTDKNATVMGRRESPLFASVIFYDAGDISAITNVGAPSIRGGAVRISGIRIQRGRFKTPCYFPNDTCIF